MIQINKYRWLSYLATMLISLLVGLLFIKIAYYYSYLYYEWVITPIFVIVVIVLFGIILLINTMTKINKHQTSFQYLKTEVFPSLMISEEEHQQAITLFNNYMKRIYFYKALFSIAMVSISFFASLLIDLMTFGYHFEPHLFFMIIITVCTYLAFFLCLLLLQIITTKVYQNNVLSIIDTHTLVFLDFSYLYLLNNYASMACPFVYKMNISAGLSRLGEIEWANIYLKQLWNEEKRMTRNKQNQIVYYFNSYLFSCLLHLDNTQYYEQKTQELLQHKPQLLKNKTIASIPLRIQIEKAFQNQQWQQVISLINEYDQKQPDQKDHTYYDYMLYTAYSYTDESKAQDYYDKNKDHPSFLKLLNLGKKA